MSEDDSVIVVCDSGPLIHLDELDSLDLLAGFRRVVSPPSVRDEVNRHRPQVFEKNSVSIEIVDAVHCPTPKLTNLGQALLLDRGEMDALALAESMSNCILLTDDNAARLAASSLNMRVHGSLAVILRAVRQGLRSKEVTIELLRQLPFRSSLHIKQSLLQEAIEALK